MKFTENYLENAMPPPHNYHDDHGYLTENEHMIIQ